MSFPLIHNLKLILHVNCVAAVLKYLVFVLTDASGMDWSTMYANALAQMLNDKSLSGVNSTSHTDVITLPQNRSAVTTTTTQQPQISSSDVAELKSSDSQLRNLLTQASPSQQARVQSDLLASALRSHSPNHSLPVPATASGTSPKPHTSVSQDLHSSNSSIPPLPTQNHDLQATGNLAGLNADKGGGVEDSKQRLSPYHAAMIASEQQLSPNAAALGMANLSNQKSPNRQQIDVKEETPLSAAVGTTLPGKEELVLTEDTTKLFLKQLAQQQQLPQQPQQQKSMPGSIVIPGGGSSDQQEELTIHPGGSGELAVMSYYTIRYVHKLNYVCMHVCVVSMCLSAFL